jgi:WD40 repeat protein
MNAQSLKSFAGLFVVIALTSCVTAPAPTPTSTATPTSTTPAPVPAAGPSRAPILRLELGMHSATAGQAGTDSQGRFVITSSWDRTARLWDASSGQLLRIFRVPSEESSPIGMLYASALSPDGRIAATSGYDWKAGVYLFDCQTGQVVRRLSGLGSSVQRLQFTPDGQYLAASFFGNKHGGYAVWRCRDWVLVGVDRSIGDESYGLVFARRDGSWMMAASSWDGKIRFYRIGDRLEKLYEYNTGAGKRPYGLSFNPDGTLLAVGYNDSALVRVFSVSLKQMTLAYTPDLGKCPATNLEAVSFSYDGGTLYAGGRNWHSGGLEVLRIWGEAGKGSYRDVTPGGTDTFVTLVAMPGGGLLVGEWDPFWAILDASGTTRVSMGEQIIDPTYSDHAQALRIGPGGRSLVFNGMEKDSHLSFDTDARSLISSPVPSRWLLPDTTSLKITNWRNRFDPRLDGKALTIENHEISRSLAIDPDAKQFVLGCEYFLYSFDKDGKLVWKKSVPGTMGVNISDDGRLAVAALRDGTIRWYRLTDGKELLILFPHPDGKRWVLWTPTGYYDASPGGENLIGWQVNNGIDAAADFYPADRFRRTYYRPDIVNLVLVTLDEKKAITRANSQAGRRQDSGSILDKRPPIVLITSPEQGSAFNSDTLTLLYRLRAPDDAPVTSVRALIDGRPMEGSRGISVVAAAEGDTSIQLNLPARDCTASLIAENRNGSSEAASVRLVWKGTAAEQNVSAHRPKLYVLAVGVSEYQKPDYHLSYSAKDARDLAALLARGSSLYRGVESRVLADADADRKGILDGLDWIEKRTTARDIAVILLSGHGINDANGDYYYLPVEADAAKLQRTGVPFSDIRAAVSHIAGKVLFFIDTCHSGNLMASRAAAVERDIVGVVNDLSSAENGAVVFASSTGSQYSYEDSSWGNGAFTKALLEGLEGAAVYGSANGLITVKRLDLYLSDRVKELTDGKQTPTTTAPPNVPDFPIAVKD